MSEEIIKLLDDLATRFGIAIDWTNENALPYLKQLCEKFIKWEISTSTAWIVLAVLASIVTWLLIFISHRVVGYIDEMILFAAIVVSVIAVGVICTQIFDIIECCTFPEKAIYDYILPHLKTIK